MNKLLTISEMAERLSVTVKTFNKYIKEYEIPFVGLGRSKRFNPDKVEKHLEKVAKYPELPKFTPPAPKIQIGENPNRDFFRKQLGL